MIHIWAAGAWSERPKGVTSTACYVTSQVVPSYIEGAVENAENVDVLFVSNQISDSIMSVHKDANVPFVLLVEVAALRKCRKHLRALENRHDNVSCSRWIFLGYKLEYVLEPLLSFLGPVKLYHERIRRSMSEFEMVFPSSESRRPRCTMTWKASSRTISSGELSSG